MENGTDKYIKTVEYLSKFYDYINSRFFDNELKKPVITIQRDEKNRSNGWWSINKVWQEKTAEKDKDGKSKSSDNGEHELNITAQMLDRSLNEIGETLMHEMCHQWASINNMQDCSRGGTYHNKLFKKIAESHGLKVSCVSRYGWTQTELTESTQTTINLFTQNNDASFIYRLPVFKGATVKSSSTRKYVCPVCGQSVRATKAVNIMCMDCNETMQCEE